MTFVPDKIDGEVAADRHPDEVKVRTGGRIGRMMVSAAAGWVLGFLATVPIKIHDLVVDAAGDERLLFHSLARGLMAWAVISLAFAIVLVALLLGPLATLVPSRWVAGHPRVAVPLLPVLFALLCAYRLLTWIQLEPGPWVYPLPLFGDYMVFGIVFLLVASVLYLRLLRRRMPAGTAR